MWGSGHDSETVGLPCLLAAYEIEALAYPSKAIPCPDVCNLLIYYTHMYIHSPPHMDDASQALEAKKDNAAAGLKTVTKDMQTWREDYKPSDAPPPPKPKVGA